MLRFRAVRSAPVALLIVVAILLGPVAGRSAVGAQSMDADGRAAIADAVTLLRDIEAALTDASEGVDGADERTLALLDEGPAVLRELGIHNVDVPDLAGLVLSGAFVVDLDADPADLRTAPAVFAAAADLLEAQMPEEGAERGGGGASLDIPIWWLAAVVAVLCVFGGGVIWFGRRAGRLEALTMVDPLTGLANRRRLDQDLVRIDAERAAARAAVSVAMVDVDHFKRFNDTYGHREGDVMLQSIGSAITGAVRPGDTVYRYGGEEFLILMRNAPQVAAVEVCEGVRHAVSRLERSVTVSVGVATGIEEPLSTLTVAADEALYRAKEEGRDRVVPTTVANRAAARVSSI